ncbi:MAG: hypothetical protein HKN29_07440 [Rhodothermales bacterium]|nr:hypothetical protein [Rhodothermales bacterium]
MPQTYVVSDWHLHHHNILKFCPNRRELFDGVEEMNAGLVEAAVNTVSPGDTLYFLGDLTFRIGTRKDEVLEALRPLADKLGAFHWIVGNHDEPTRMPQVAALFDSVVDAVQFRIGGRQVYLSHYPLEVAPRDRLRLASIHGHHHGTVDSPPGRVDVSIDALYGDREHFDPDYAGAPITLETALDLAGLDLRAPYPGSGKAIT